jgi:4-alpha-glucanotransferase
MERKSGVLMHISSLFGEYSIGGFGKSAKEFVDFLSDCGFSYWQVLPFCMADEFN